MSEIKYRGKRENGDWIEGYYCKWQDRHYIAPDPHECGFTGGEVLMNDIAGFITVIPKTVGQNIGAKDKNNLEIWQDNIMQSEDGLRKYVVTYNERKAKWFLKGLGEAWPVNDPLWWKYENTSS